MREDPIVSEIRKYRLEHAAHSIVFARPCASVKRNPGAKWSLAARAYCRIKPAASLIHHPLVVRNELHPALGQHYLQFLNADRFAVQFRLCAQFQ